MPPKSAPLTQAAIHRMIKDNVDATIAAESELLRWFEKSESVFGISECAEGKKVRFATATLQGPTLTWWNAKVATWGLETVNRMPWTKMKHLMTVVFCPIEEIQRMKHELWNLKVKEYNIMAYTQRFNKPALMYPRMVEPKRVKPMRMAHKLMDQKAQARDERILEGNKQKWESFQNGNSSGEGNQRDNSCQTLQNKQRQGNARAMVTAPADGRIFFVNDVLLAMLISIRSSATSVERLGTSQGHTRNRCPKKVKQDEVTEVYGRAYAIKDADPKGPNVVTSTFLINNCYAFVLFDPDSDRIFMDTRFSSMLAIDPVKIGASYEVELADGRVVSTNIILKGVSGDESDSAGMRLQHHRLILK
nr:hypothetical protein [Tanacetum cinerariifolium]